MAWPDDAGGFHLLYFFKHDISYCGVDAAWGDTEGRGGPGVNGMFGDRGITQFGGGEGEGFAVTVEEGEEFMALVLC